MSDQHVTRETLARLQRRELPAEELTQALRHVGTCAECRGRVDVGNVANVRSTITPIVESEHLDVATQLIPYVDGTLDRVETEIVESHLDDCATCRAEVEDLRSMGAPQPVSHGWIVALAALIAAVVVAMVALVGRVDPARTVAPNPVIKVVPPPVDPPRHRFDNAHWEKLVADAVAQKRLPFPASLDELNPPPDPLRNPGEGENDGLSPVGVVVESARPQFSWKASEGATYTVVVYDGETEVARSEALQEPRWKPSRDLPRGRTLAWQVEATRGEAMKIVPAPPSPPALFRIITAEEESELRTAIANFPSEPLLHAVLYARAGLRAEAEEALKRAVAAGDWDVAESSLRKTSREQR